MRGNGKWNPNAQGMTYVLTCTIGIHAVCAGNASTGPRLPLGQWRSFVSYAVPKSLIVGRDTHVDTILPSARWREEGGAVLVCLTTSVGLDNT